MADGAVSASRRPAVSPGTYADGAEILGLARVAGSLGGVYSLSRACGTRNSTGAERSRRRSQVGKIHCAASRSSTFKVDRPALGAQRRALSLIDRHALRGVDVERNSVSYAASSTLGIRFPSLVARKWTGGDGDSADNAATWTKESEPRNASPAG